MMLRLASHKDVGVSIVILIGIGANLRSPMNGPAIETCRAALTQLGRHGIAIESLSHWYATEPVGGPGQPAYVNAVAGLRTHLAPHPLLDLLQSVERLFGRRRGAKNAPRTLDLDLLAHGDAVLNSRRLTLPHPGLAERAFVLLPLADIAPAWRDPRSGLDVGGLLKRLNGRNAVRKIA